MEKDDYIQSVIAQGDEGSKLLAKTCTTTLKNSELVDIIQEGMNGIAVLRIPQEHVVFVHSIGGNPKEKDLASYTASMVERLVNASKKQGLEPIGFANVIDASEGKKEDIELIGKTLVERANQYKLPILNGELAILGNRVNCTANIMGTMISTAKRELISKLKTLPTIITSSGINYAAFDPQGKAIYINSDGIGTKTEFYERAKRWHLGLGDSLAMKLDDTIKIGATAMVASDVVETKGRIPFETLQKQARWLGEKTGIMYILQREIVGDRIRGYSDNSPSYNISGSSVSLIDEERLKNPLKPSEGEFLIAIRGNPNPRSNGITDKRKIAIKLLGDDYQETREGKLFLEYLAEPSTVLYPIFKKLIDEQAATSVYHMSGGAYNGKLARPIAKHGLFVEINNIFPPDYRELALAGANFTSAQTAYGKWPMGNDGFITTKDSDNAIEIIKNKGLEAKVVGQLERTDRTGVELTAFNGEKVYYKGD